MKQKLTSEELVVKFNKLRLENLGRTFSSEELDTLLKQDAKFNSNLAYEIKKELFDVSRNGTKKFFRFRTEPAYQKKMEVILNNYRKSFKRTEPSVDEERLIQQLQKAGYQIRKPIGFDQEKFAKENPELYKKYLVYESV